MLKIITIMVLVLIISSAGAFASYSIAKFFDEHSHQEVNEAKDFTECVNSGNATIETDPLRCIDSLGTVFVKDTP